MHDEYKKKLIGPFRYCGFNLEGYRIVHFVLITQVIDFDRRVSRCITIIILKLNAFLY